MKTSKASTLRPTTIYLLREAALILGFSYFVLAGGTLLPDHSNLHYNPRDDRYPPYSHQVAASDRPVYVAFQEPHLDRLLRPSFAAMGVSCREQDIGPYRVFYDLSAKVEPWQLQPYPGQPAPPRGGQPW